MLATFRSLSVSGALAPTDFSSPLGRIPTRSRARSASVRTLANQSNEYAGQKREDERLQKCDEQFENRDAEGHENRHGHKEPASESENEADERKQDDVPGGHVGEETDRQRERLGELSD